MFFLEVIIGQYTSEGGITCWEKICPLFSGESGTEVTRAWCSSIQPVLWSTYYLPGTLEPDVSHLALCLTLGSSQYVIHVTPLLTVTAPHVPAVPPLWVVGGSVSWQLLRSAVQETSTRVQEPFCLGSSLTPSSCQLL